MGSRSRNFPPAADAIIVHRLVAELSTSGLTVKGKFPEAVWDSLSLELHNAGHQYKPKSISGRFDRLKSTIEEVNSIKGMPNFAWDPENLTIVAENECWDGLLKVNQGARRLRDKCFPLYPEIMELITAQSNVGTGRRSASITTQYSSQSVKLSESSDISTHPDENVESTETAIDPLTTTNSLLNDFSGNQVITHDMKDKVQWWNALKSYPLQVHALLIRPQTENGTPWADAPQTLYPALEALAEIAKSEDETWQALVLDGVVRTLCWMVLDLVSFTNTLTYLPSDLRQQADQAVSSPYHPPLQVLYYAACRIDPLGPPIPVTVTFLETIHSFWPSILQRVWQEPSQTLNLIDQHIKERVVVAQLFNKLLILTPSILSSNEIDGLGLLVLARLWTHATAISDVAAVTTTICEILHPCLSTAQHPRNIRPLQKDAISQLLRGFGTNPNAFCDNYVSRLFWLPSAELSCYLQFFREIHHACSDDGDALHRAFKLTMSGHTPFWINGLVILRRMARNVPMFDADHHQISLAVVGHAATCIYYVQGNMYECERVISQWMTADIFGTFDDLLAHSLSYGEFSVQLARFFRGLYLALQAYPNHLLRHLTQQFPRPRTTRALFFWKNTAEPDTELKAALWETWLILERLSRFGSESECIRRGCANTAHEICPNQRCAAKYCSYSCRQKDWLEHSWVCGL